MVNWLEKLKSGIKSVLSFVFSNRIFVILLSALLFVLKFRSIIIDLLVKDSKSILNDAKKQDSELAGVQDENNKKANDLVDHANSLDSNKQPIDENWNKKK